MSSSRSSGRPSGNTPEVAHPLEACRGWHNSRATRRGFSDPEASDECAKGGVRDFQLPLAAPCRELRILWTKETQLDMNRPAPLYLSPMPCVSIQPPKISLD